MNKLREKLYDAIHLEVFVNESGYVDGIQYADEKCEQITDDFSVKFAEWMLNSNELYRLGMKETTATELLQIFKTQYYGKE